MQDMLTSFKKKLIDEWRHFQKLSSNAKLILISYLSYQSASSLLLAFINLYLWRSSSNNSIDLVLLYNLGLFIALPFSFYLNGLALKHSISAKKLYWLGTFITGFSAFFVIFLPTGKIGVLLKGLIAGLGGGLFWANKNYLTLKATQNTNRTYYNNIEFIVIIISSLVMSLISGWFISFAHISNLYSIDFAYRIIALIGFLLLFYSGYIIQRLQVGNPNMASVLPKKVSSVWKANRTMHFLLNVISGINFFLPSVLIMYHLSSEGVFGTFQGISSLFSALLLYYVGRKTSTKHVTLIVSLALIVALIGAVQLQLSFNLIGAIVYLVVTTIVTPLRYTPSYTLSMELMDREFKNGNVDSTYPLIVDNEIISNLGRIVSLLIFWLTMTNLSQEVALKTTPLIIAFLTFPLIIPLKKIVAFLTSTAIK